MITSRPPNPIQTHSKRGKWAVWYMHMCCTRVSECMHKQQVHH